MARIRTIKPEFFTSEDIVSLSPLARLLYIALWCEADREGRLAWKPRTFKMRYLPGDDCNADELCAELIGAGLVRLYGDGLAYIPTFHKHQHLNPRESKSILPEHDKNDASPRDSDASPRDSDAQVGREGKGKEGNSVAIATGADAPDVDPSEVIFGLGVPILTAANVSDRNARSMLGLMRKTCGDAAVVEAIRRCSIAKPLEPVAWLQAAVKPAKTGKHAGFESKDYRAGINADGTIA